MINRDFKGKDILSLDQFTSSDISILFKITAKMKKNFQEKKYSDLLKNTIITLLFYEPSSRTFGSFCGAVKRLGGETIDVTNPMQNSSAAKGETLEDTIRVFEAYSDAIVIRHPTLGSVQKAADAAFFVPIFNAGDGIGEHPTQALMDLYTIYEQFGRLDNLTGVIAGDLLNGRTVHSLLRGLAKYKQNKLYLLSPQQLRLKSADFLYFQKEGIKLVEIDDEKEIPKDAQFWYWTRVQKERFENLDDYEKVKNTFIVTPKLLKTYGNSELILMHPLPRVGEIVAEVDTDPRAIYLKSEIRNGVFVRMALLTLVLGKI